MKRKLLKALLVAMMLVLGTGFLFGCSNDAKNLEGSWKFEDPEQFELLTFDDASETSNYGLQFHENGEVSILFVDTKSGFVLSTDHIMTYTLSDGTIEFSPIYEDYAMAFSGSDLAFRGTYSLNGDIFEITLEDGTIAVLERT